MNINTLRVQGWTLLNVKPYKAQTMPSGAQMIVLPAAAGSQDKKYFEAVDKTGNILLILEENLSQ